jgi:hypothetical protein
MGASADAGKLRAAIVTKLPFHSALVGGSERRGSGRECDQREQLMKERSGEDKSSGRVVFTRVAAKVIDASNFLVDSAILLCESLLPRNPYFFVD